MNSETPQNAGQKNKMSAYKLEKKERRLEAMRLRRQGMTFAEIGRVLGISRQAAHKYIEREFKALLKEGNQVAEKALSLTLARYEELLKISYREALTGNRAALEDSLAIMDRQIKVLGLEAPKKSETNITYNHFSDAELVEQAKLWGIIMPQVDAPVVDITQALPNKSEDSVDK